MSYTAYNGSRQIEDSAQTIGKKKVWAFKYVGTKAWAGSLLNTYMKFDGTVMRHVNKLEDASHFTSQVEALDKLQSHVSENKGYCSSHALEQFEITSYLVADFKWFSVPSSTLCTRIGYSRAKRAFAVEFVSGGIYVYEDVNESFFTNALLADSFGAYFNAYLKGSKRSIKL